jgi:hypothetical protein
MALAFNDLVTLDYNVSIWPKAAGMLGRKYGETYAE